MIYFVSASFDAGNQMVECLVCNKPIDPVDAYGVAHRSVGVVRLKDGVSPYIVRHHVESDGQGGGRFADTISDVATFFCPRTPATRREITEALATRGDAGLHVLARTWLAEKLPAEQADYYGQPLESHPRAVPIVRAMIERAAHPAWRPTGYAAHMARTEGRDG